MELAITSNQLKIQTTRYLKRIWELNSLLFDLAEGWGDKFVQAAKSLKQVEEGSKSPSELQVPRKEIVHEEGEDSPQVISLSPSEREGGFGDAVSGQ